MDSDFCTRMHSWILIVWRSHHCFYLRYWMPSLSKYRWSRFSSDSRQQYKTAYVEPIHYRWHQCIRKPYPSRVWNHSHPSQGQRRNLMKPCPSHFLNLKPLCNPCFGCLAYGTFTSESVSHLGLFSVLRGKIGHYSGGVSIAWKYISLSRYRCTTLQLLSARPRYLVA